MIKSIGVIGIGRFGSLLIKHLSKINSFEIYAYDCNERKNQFDNSKINFVSLKECSQKNIVILCVPISKFEDTLKKIKPFLIKDSIVFDVCSVKEIPVDLMKNIIPLKCDCIGTHPLFGPDSVKENLKGKKIILCPIRIKKIDPIIKFLKSLGLSVIISNPEEHDRQMAQSLSIIHLLGKTLNNLDLKQITMTTPTHKRLIELIDIVNNDSKQLFYDMQLYNKFSKYYRKKLIKSLVKLDGELDGRK